MTSRTTHRKRAGAFVTKKPRRRKNSFDPKTFLANVGEGKAIAKYRKGSVIFSQGDAADSVFYVQKGRVKLTVVSEQGKEAVIAILGPAHFFGEGCLNGHALRIATTTAMDDCVITRITKAAMIATMHNEPRFSELFMAYLLERNGRIEEDNCLIPAKSVSPGFSFSLRISARRAGRSRSWGRSVRKPWRK